MLLDYSNLPFADNCFNETLRLDTPVKMAVVRTVLEDIEIGGYRFKKGTNLYINNGAPMKSPQYW